MFCARTQIEKNRTAKNMGKCFFMIEKD
jgi:hypothetical protein